MFAVGSFILTPGEVEKRKRYLEITSADEQRLKSAASRLQARSPEITERFYEYLLGHEHTRKILEAPGLLPRLKELQGKYFFRLTSGQYDLDYFEDRLRVGQVHFRIGLTPEWYLGAYLKYLHIVSDVLSQAFGRDYETFFQTLVSLTKVIYLDTGLALDAYHYSAQEGLEKKTADLERANQEIKRIQAAKQQVTDLIVHDLQNPLAGITSVFQILDEEPEGLSQGRQEVIREALGRCDDLSQMIMNVLQISRAEKGELEACLEEVDVHRLAHEVARAYGPVAKLAGHHLEVDSGSAVTVRTDGTLVRRILQNLIRNAIRHTPLETSVVVRVETSDLGSVRLSVADDGPGIPLEIQPLLFEPFGAAAIRSIGRRVDTGLGLASCRAAARVLGTDVVVESDGKRGTIFSLQLPVLSA